MSQELNLIPSSDQSNVLTLIVGHTCITTLNHFYDVPKYVQVEENLEVVCR